MIFTSYFLIVFKTFVFTHLFKDPAIYWRVLKKRLKFKIETPIGSYNPDWAVFLEKDGEQKLYFILETKGTTSLFELRPTERLRINCGRKHFEALDGVEFSELPVKDWKEFKVNL